MFDFLFPDKASLREAATSMTAWGLFLYGAAKAAEQAGFLSPGITEQAAGFAQVAAPVLVVLGIRKAAGAAKVAATDATSVSVK